MFTKKKLRFSVIATLIMSLLIVAACGNTNNEESGNVTENEGGEATAAAPVTFKAFIAPDGRIENMETNEFTKYLEEKQNIKIEWMTVTSGEDITQKKNLLMSTGDYPELMWVGFSPAEQYKLGTTGLLKPLNDLIDKYAPNIKALMDKDERFKNGMTAADGNIYALTTYSECFHCTYSQKAWINKKWLDNLGLPVPTTTEEFYETLKAFKTEDPNKNGKADEIPMTGAKGTWNADVYGFLMNPFIYNNNYTEIKDGKVSFVPDKPEYKAGLEYMNMLYKEKLIDTASFTQNLDSMIQLINSAERVGVYTAGHVAMGVTLDSPNYKDWVALPPLKGPNGVQHTGYFPNGFNGGGFSITDKASEEQAIAIIKMFDYLFTEEGTIKAIAGANGEWLLEVGPEDKDFNGNPAKYRQNPEMRSDTKIQNISWHDMGGFAFSNAVRESFSAPTDMYAADGYEFRLFTDTKNSYAPYAPKDVLPPALPLVPEDEDRLALLRTDISKYVDERRVQFITGDMSLNSGWDDYVSSFTKLKADEYISILQKAYDQLQQ